jgi:hypothetical protein
MARHTSEAKILKIIQKVNGIEFKRMHTFLLQKYGSKSGKPTEKIVIASSGELI